MLSNDFVEPAGNALASARTELVKVRSEIYRRLRDFRLAIEIAGMAGLGPDTVCGDFGDGGGITVKEMERLVWDCEAEEARVCALLALLDTQIESCGRLSIWPGD
jgi:hypothetical protein